MIQKFICYTSMFSTGERFPVLLHVDSYQPAILATRYIIDQRRENKQLGTLLRDIRVLKWFYEWCYSNNIELENILQKGGNLSVGEITRFCRYLRAGRNNTVIGSTGEIKHVSILSPTSFNSYISVVENFLIWSSYEYMHGFVSDEIKETVEISKERIQKIFRSNRIGGRNPENRYGLSKEEIIKIRKAITPKAKLNPYKQAVQFRNYVIIELFLATGIRRGELLKLKLNDLPQGPKTTLSIEKISDDPLDSRRIEPQVKTRGREIPIPKVLAKDLWTYVQKYRKRGNHRYLFTSHRKGVPLDLGAINWIFEILVKRSFPELKGRLHPHILRHTFNDQLLEKAIELKWGDEQRRKVQIYLNGWSDNSTMPEIYTRRITEGLAMKLMEQYQADLYKE